MQGLIRNWAIPIIVGIIASLAAFMIQGSAMAILIVVAILAVSFGLNVLARRAAGVMRRRHPNPVIYSASVVVLDESGKRVLLERRGPNTAFYPNRVALPGGHMKADEQPQQTALRELSEETGLSPVDVAYLGLYSDTSSDMSMFAFGTRVPSDSVVKGEFKWYPLGEVDRMRTELAPNTHRVVLEGVRQTSSAGVLGRTEHVRGLAVRNLIENVQIADGLHGWDHYLKTKGIGIVNTNVGLLTVADDVAAYKLGIVNEILKSVVGPLRNKDGGWGKTSTNRESSEPGGLSIAESTAFGLLAIKRAGLQDTHEAVTGGARWLNDNSNADGSIGVNRFHESRRVYTTCLKALALSGVSGQEAAVAKCVEWLRSAQISGEGWPVGDLSSAQRKLGSSLAATALVVYAANTLGKHSDLCPGIEDAEKYIMKRAAAGGPLQDEEEHCYAYDSSRKEPFNIEIKYDTRALVLLSLCTIDTHVHLAEVDHCVDILDRFDPACNWLHSLCGGHSPVWATYWNVLALSAFRDKLVSNARAMVRA